MTISNRDVIDEFKQVQAQGAGQQLAGGSSGSGGYRSESDGRTGEGDDAAFHTPVTRELSRGERYDMEQGGGRGDDAVDFGDELKQDERERADAGQRFLDNAGDGDDGAVSDGQQP